MRKKIAVPHHLYVAPLTYGLVCEAPAVDLLADHPAANAIKLRNREVDGAFLSPIDYARESSDYIILPDLAAASRNGSRSIELFFHSGLPSLHTVAVEIGLTSEIVLARIILAEKYDLHPQFLPMMPDLSAMLEKADAALLAGNSTFAHGAEQHRFDLVEEWTDLTGLPYVHGFWVSTPNSLTENDLRLLVKARDDGRRNLDAIMKTVTGAPERYLEQFSYELDDEAVESISEYFRYSFYYGVIADVPELRIGDAGDNHHTISAN